MSSRISGKARSFAKAPHKYIFSWLQDGLIQRLLKNSGWLLGGTTFATAIGLISLPLKTHALGAAQFGLLTVVLAYIALMERLTSFRSWIPLIKFGAAALAKDQKRELAGYVKLAFLMDLTGALLGSALAFVGARVFAAWQGWDSDTIRLLSIASLLPLFNLIEGPTGVLRIFDRFKRFTMQKMVEAILGVAGTLLAWWMEWGILGFLISSLVAVITGRLLLVAMAWEALRRHGVLAVWKESPVQAPGKFLRFGGWSYLSSVMDIPVKQLDVIILSAALSLEASGIYRIIKQVVGLLVVLTDPIYQAVYPQFSAMMVDGGLAKSLKYSLKIGLLIGAVVAPVSLMLATTSAWWLPKIFGEEFRAGWIALSLFLALKVLTLPTLPIHPLFAAAGYVKQTVWIIAFSNSVYLLLLWKFSTSIGLAGPVLAWFIQSVLVASLKLNRIRIGLKQAHIPAGRSL